MKGKLFFDEKNWRYGLMSMSKMLKDKISTKLHQMSNSSDP
jgi:hypothetical protein